MASDLEFPDGNDQPRASDDDNGSEDQKEKLLGVLRREEQAAAAWQNAELTAIREDALNYYDRMPIGNEEEGQSKIVTSEFADAIESVMPGMMRVFAGTDQVVQFQPRALAFGTNPQDAQLLEQYAKEANDYVPHVLMRENPGYTIVYWFVKDALMYRLAGGCVDIEEVEQVKTEEVNGLGSDEWALTRQDLQGSADKIGADINFNVAQDGPTADPADEGEAAPPSPTPPVSTFSGKITTKRKVQRVVVENIAPEDILFTPQARKQDDASFQGYRKKTTASELRTLGLSQEDIDNLASDHTQSIEESQRQPSVVQNTSDRKDSERELWLVLGYVKFDWDGDGISEMRRCVYAHANGETSALIKNEPWTDGVAPIFLGTPILMSHTIPGRSLFDQTRDLQDIGTEISRGMLDNAYAVNRPRPTVSDKVNLADVLDWTPGQPVRLMQGATATPDNLSWLQVPPIMDKALAVLQWKDTVAQRRTGISPNNQDTLDPGNPTATGASIVSSSAGQRTELMARTLAETGFQRLYLLLYRAIKRAASGPVTYWNGAAWANCDPTKWPDDMQLTVDVGPGTGNKALQLANLQTIGAGQSALAKEPGGQAAVTTTHLANTLRKGIEAAGFKNTALFVASDEEIKAAQAKQAQQPPPPDPAMAAVQAESQAAMAKVQSDHQVAMQKLQGQIQLEQTKAQADMQLQREKAALDMQLAREKAQLDAQLKREQLQQEAQLKALQIASQPTNPGPGATETQQQQVSP